MGLFSRIRDVFRGRQYADLGDDRLNHIWHDVVDELPSRQLEKFQEDALEVFETAYVDDVDHDARLDARQRFEELLEEYSIDISEFDWDSWRDWYDGQAS